MKEPSSIMEKCNCGSESIEVQYWGDELGNEFFFSLWRNGFQRQMSWRERLRWCWRILCTGDPWADSIIVSSEQAKRIADFINHHSDTKEKTNES
jgi:hypothetical protein